ncbi:hypothetical protein [Campylobacter sp. CCS1377]|uniref:Pyridoxamine 5'-phosphate oxidase putative domain-containing protein n=1 Tax=Campylobacter sp. CCS1377 TaxID=3158229 RepID=A0AAU7E712_9BACT|nr:hypothetical protein [Campylobacter jejuni]
MDERIKKFIASCKLLSWAMRDEKGVYIANAFYAFDERNLALIIASHEDTKHIKLAFKESKVAVNIAKESTIAFLQGVQIKANFCKANEMQIQIYYKKFPFAKLLGGTTFALEIEYVKFTDNSLMLTKKLEFYQDFVKKNEL